MNRYVFYMLCLGGLLQTKSTQSNDQWKHVGIKVNDIETANHSLTLEEMEIENSIFLDQGCDNALQEAGGLPYLESLWYNKSENHESQPGGKFIFGYISYLFERFGHRRVDRFALRRCSYSRYRSSCLHCNYMRYFRGRYFCCTSGLCRKKGVPVINYIPSSRTTRCNCS